MVKHFYLDEYIEGNPDHEHDRRKPVINSGNKLDLFYKLCSDIKEHFMFEWESEQGRTNDSSDKLLEYQKKAIIGYHQEVNFFKGKINEYLKKNSLFNEWYPRWYHDLTSAIFHENWGLTGIAEWKELKNSTSAKIIGERIYFLIDGKMMLQEQKIAKDRFNQLRKALLLRNPEIRLDNKHAEVYMLDGTRITIYDEGLGKEPVIVFRKYIIDTFTFEEQAKRGTIPVEVIPMFKAMVRIGFNINFIGPIRSGKTTFLETWQSYEDPSLEGVLIETDPEIPLHLIMPYAPIVQLTADGDKLKNLIKPILRSDADYLIMAEARDAVALYIALKVTEKGTRRVKSTFHSSDATDFIYDAANEIIQEFGGNLWSTVIKVAKGYHYLFEFVQLKDKSKKRLKGIFEIRYNPKTLEISVHQIMKYNFLTDTWTYKYDFGKDKEDIALQEDYQSFKILRHELKKLAEKKPLQGEHVTIPPYIKLMFNGSGSDINVDTFR